MTVKIRGNVLSVSGASQNAGIFIGQNISDGWDSIATEKATAAFNMGDFSATFAVYAEYLGASYLWQPVWDGDTKGNDAPQIMI